MLHHIHKCTNTLYGYVIIINTYVSLMYELKKNLRVNLLGLDPRLIKRICGAAVSQRLRNTGIDNRLGIPHDLIIAPP